MVNKNSYYSNVNKQNTRTNREDTVVHYVCNHGTGMQHEDNLNIGIIHMATEAAAPHLATFLDKIPTFSIKDSVKPVSPRDYFKLLSPDGSCFRKMCHFEEENADVQNSNASASRVVINDGPNGTVWANRPGSSTIRNEVNHKVEAAVESLFNAICSDLISGLTVKVVLNGFSRGACISLYIAHAIQNKFDNLKKSATQKTCIRDDQLQIGLFLVDPVPGTGLKLTDPKLRTIPSRVTFCTTLLAQDECRFGFDPLHNLKPESKSTKITQIVLPGHHNSLIRCNSDDKNYGSGLLSSMLYMNFHKQFAGSVPAIGVYVDPNSELKKIKDDAGYVVRIPEEWIDQRQIDSLLQYITTSSSIKRRYQILAKRLANIKYFPKKIRTVLISKKTEMERRSRVA